MDRRKIRITLIGLIATVLLVALACARTPAPPPTPGQEAKPPAPAAAPTSITAPAPVPTRVPAVVPALTPPTAAAARVLPRRSGSILLPIPDLLKGTDPHTTQSLAKEVWLQASNTLIRIDPLTFTLQPGLIESWSVADEGKSITLNVRKGVKWQNLPPVNGREFTAEDVAYNLKRIAGRFPAEGKTFYRAGDLIFMDNAVATDKYTVKMTIKQPSASILGNLSNVFSPVAPQELVQQCGGILDDTTKCTIGTGPFILKTFQDGVQATWTRNPDYWRIGEDGKPLPYVDEVRWVWFGDVATIVAAIATGKAAMYQKAGDAEIRSMIAAKSRVRLKPYDKTVVWAAIFNHDRPPFNDLRVRTAVDLVMERRKSLDNVQGNTPWTWTGFLPRVYGDFALPEDEVIKRPGFRDDKTEDIRTARQLLEQAAYGPNKPLKFKAYASATSTCGRECPILMADQVNTHLKGLAEVEPAPVPSAERSQRQRTGDFDLFFNALAADSADPGALLIAWYHSKGGRNSSRYANNEMDQLLAEQDRTFDREKRKQLMWQIQRKGLDERILVVWGNTWATMVMVPNLQGWIPGGDTAGGDIFYNLDQVWFTDAPTPSSWPIIDK